MERSRTTYRELSQRTIREYNIRGHVFLARDRGAHGLEGSQQSFFRDSHDHIVAYVSHSRFGFVALEVPRPARLIFVLRRDGGDSKAVVASAAARPGGG